MALIRLKEKRGRPGGGLASFGADGNYTRIFIASYNADVTSEVTVAAASIGGVTVPVVGEAHDADARSLCTSVLPRPARPNGGGWTLRHWEVVCKYAVPSTTGWVLDPTSRPWVASVSSVDTQYIPDSALDSGGAAADPQVNAAGEIWDNPVMDVSKRMIIHLEKNVTTPPTLATVGVLSGSVNSASITILGKTFGVRELYMDSYHVGPEQEDTAGNDYHLTAFDLIYRADTWDHMLANVGWNYKTGGVLVPFFIDGNKEPEMPQRLAADGDDGRAAPMNYLQRRIKTEQSWAALGFPVAW